MSQSSSGENRNRRDGSRSGGSSNSRNRNRGGNRGGGNRNRQGGENRSGGSRRPRKPEPELTGFQKFLKAISFGLIDPAKSAKSSSSPKRDQGRSGRPQSGDSKPDRKSDRKPRRKPEAVEPTTPRLYVGNLNYDVTDEQLGEMFAPVGTVKEAAVVRHGGSGRSKGFAFVEMSSLDEAKAAVSKLNDEELMGRQMLVTGAKAEKPRREGSENRDSGRGERREGSRERSGGRSGERRSRDGERRERSGGRERKGRGDRIEKPTRQVKALEVEEVTTPKLLIANVNAEATDEDLGDLFSDIGSVVSRAAADGKEGAATVDYEVEFSALEEAQKAVELLHGKSFMGNQLRVSGSGGDAPKAAETAEVSEEKPAAEETPSEPEAPVEAPAEEPSEAPVEEASDAPVESEAPAEEAAPDADAGEPEKVADKESPKLEEGEPAEEAPSEEWSPSKEDEKS